MDTQKLAMSVSAFCAEASISRGTLYELWKSGYGPNFIKVGRRTLILRSAAEDWLKSLEVGPTALRAKAGRIGAL